MVSKRAGRRQRPLLLLKLDLEVLLGQGAYHSSGKDAKSVPACLGDEIPSTVDIFIPCILPSGSWLGPRRRLSLILILSTVWGTASVIGVCQVSPLEGPLTDCNIERLRNLGQKKGIFSK